MKSKSAWFLAAVSSLVSTAVGQGNYTGNYSEAVNATLNPANWEQVKVFSEMMGWHIAGLLAVPFLSFLVLGFLNGEVKRESYWEIVILSFLFTLVALVALLIVLLRF